MQHDQSKEHVTHSVTIWWIHKHVEHEPWQLHLAVVLVCTDSGRSGIKQRLDLIQLHRNVDLGQSLDNLPL